MKKKMYILSIILGVIFCLSSLFGFLGLYGVKNEIAGYDGSNEVFTHIQDRYTYEYYDNYWDYLAHHECTTISTCYCEFVDNEKDCLNQLLSGTGKHVNANKGQVFLIKYRYISLVLAIVSFVGTWLFYEKKVTPNKKAKQAKED